MNARVVIMNDTSNRYHHGCARVMRCLREGLQSRGLDVIATSPARNDWEKDQPFLTALAGADLVVINGEGTIHDNAPAGETLLRVANHPAAANAKKALVNALFDNNPSDWRVYLENFDLLAARDSHSAKHLSDVSGKPVNWLPDLSLSQKAKAPTGPRHDIIIGDSVKTRARKALANGFRQFPNARFVPTKTLRSAAFNAPIIRSATRSLLYRPYMSDWSLRTPRFDMPQNEGAYLACLTQAKLHISGRFHAICYSLLARTPFVAVSSINGKIERLLSDLGLKSDRVFDPETFAKLKIDPQSFEFSDDEKAAIERALDRAQTQANTLFDDLAQLARSSN